MALQEYTQCNPKTRDDSNTQASVKLNTNEENVLSPLPENRLLPLNSTRVFKSPPQPHMCIQDICEYKGSKRTCFVNIMSWSKIGLPSRPSAPIPIYGGIKVPLNNRSGLVPKEVKRKQDKPVLFAVMVNPYVLKQSGKNAQNQVDLGYLMDVILDFIETMNENLRFSRKYTILKDRDLTGELKDIWAVIQAKREFEKMQSLNNGAFGDENRHSPSPPAPSSQITKHISAGGEEDEGPPPSDLPVQ